MGRFFSSENGMKKSQIQGAGEWVTCHSGHCWNTPNFTTNFQVSLKNRDIWGSKPQKKVQKFQRYEPQNFSKFSKKNCGTNRNVENFSKFSKQNCGTNRNVENYWFRSPNFTNFQNYLENSGKIWCILTLSWMTSDSPQYIVISSSFL